MNSFKECIKNLGLFYLLILIIISIPLLVVLVVLGIKTIIDLRYWLLGFGTILLTAAIVILYKRRKKYSEEFKKDKEEILKILEQAISLGHDVDISFMGGLLKVSYRSSHIKDLPSPKENTQLLPKSVSDNSSA